MKIGLKSKMTKDVIWTFSIQIAIMLCSFAVTKLLSNRLSIDDFGQYNLIKRSIQVLSFVMLAGVGITLPRYIPLYKKGEQQKSIIPQLIAALIYIIGVTIIVCAICGAFSAKLQPTILGENDNNTLYAIALAYAFILALCQYVFAYYRGIGNFKRYNGTQLAIQIAIILPLIFIPILTTTTVFASWLIITTALVAIYIGRELLFKKFLKLSIASIKSEFNTIVRYSSGRLVADLFLFSLSAFPLIYISNTQGLQPTAYYSVGITFVTMVTPVYSFMGIILLPFVSECIAKNQLNEAKRFVNRLSLFYIATALVIILIMYLFISFFTSLFFANSYLITTDISRIMILSILPQALYLLFRNPIDAVSIKPYNAIILGICLIAMIIVFSQSSTLSQFAWAYLFVSILQGALSFITWIVIKKPTKI